MLEVKIHPMKVYILIGKRSLELKEKEKEIQNL